MKRNNIIPAIATGRSGCALPDEIYDLIEKFSIELFVTINGQYNRYQQQEITTFPITMSEIERLIAFFQQHQIDYAFVSEQAIAVNRVTDKIDQALRPITERYIVDPDYYLQHRVYQMLVFYDESQDQLIAGGQVFCNLIYGWCAGMNFRWICLRRRARSSRNPECVGTF